MGIFSALKKMDMYRTVPKDLQEAPTLHGAITTILCSAIVVYLFFSEFMLFMTTELRHEMFVEQTADTGNQHAMIQINMNISLPAVPCAVLSVDAQDIMGSHVVDVGGDIHKTRLNPDLTFKLAADGSIAPIDVEDPREMMGEGCNVHGNMVVKRVPGNFHVSAHAHANLLHKFFGGVPMNVSHVIHKLWFGEDEALMNAVESAHANPLEGASKYTDSGVHGIGDAPSYEYYIKVVPTEFIDESGKENGEAYQFVANSNEIVGRYRVPAIYFRYDMSPITVRFTQTSMAFSHFLVQLCAIVGGVLSVMQMLNSAVGSASKRFKTNIGKLG